MITPYVRPPKPKPVGLLDRGARFRAETGQRFAIDASGSRSFNVYADHRVALDLAHRGVGALSYFNSTAIKWISPGGVKVTILPVFIEHRQADALAGLAILRDFLADRNAGGTSITSMSYSLLRATIREDLPVQGGQLFNLPQVVGGRQESAVPDGAYGSFIHLDLQAAYAHALGDLNYAGEWVPWPYRELPDDPSQPMLVRARVKVPAGLAFAPLPRRSYKRPNAWERRFGDIEYPKGKTVQGIWSADEIRAAITVGCEVRVIEAQIMAHESYPFRPWLAEVMEARKLPGLAGDLGKMLGNTLVGRFMIDAGDRAEVTFNDDNTVRDLDYLPEHLEPRWMRPIDVAEIVTGKVRARLYTELMTPFAADLIGVHTDGGLVKPRHLAPVTFLPSDWREKEAGVNLRWLGPQCWSFTDAQGARQYKVSGIPPELVARTFAELWRSSQTGGKVIASGGPVGNDDPWKQGAML